MIVYTPIILGVKRTNYGKFSFEGIKTKALHAHEQSAKNTLWYLLINM